MDEPLVWYEGSGTNDRRWLITDERGSVIGSTDASGTVTQVNKYDAYGVPDAANQGLFQYTGQLWIPELGLYHYKARAYSARLGRFMQTDPIGYAGGMNLYSYVGNDPVGRRDPSGLCDFIVYNNTSIWSTRAGEGPRSYFPLTTSTYETTCVGPFPEDPISDPGPSPVSRDTQGTPQAQRPSLCDALEAIAATADSNDFLNGSRFQASKLATEVVPPGGGPIDNSHFVEPRNGLVYDVQWIQVGWSLTDTFGRNIPQQFGVGYLVAGGALQSLYVRDLSFFRNGNVGADMRGLQLGEFGAGNFETFRSFVSNLCPAPRQ